MMEMLPNPPDYAQYAGASPSATPTPTPIPINGAHFTGRTQWGPNGELMEELELADGRVIWVIAEPGQK